MTAAIAVVAEIGMKVDYLGRPFVIDSEVEHAEDVDRNYVTIKGEGRTLMAWVEDLVAMDGSPVV